MLAKCWNNKSLHYANNYSSINTSPLMCKICIYTQLDLFYWVYNNTSYIATICNVGLQSVMDTKPHQVAISTPAVYESITQWSGKMNIIRGTAQYDVRTKQFSFDWCIKSIALAILLASSYLVNMLKNAVIWLDWSVFIKYSCSYI